MADAAEAAGAAAAAVARVGELEEEDADGGEVEREDGRDVEEVEEEEVEAVGEEADGEAERRREAPGGAAGDPVAGRARVPEAAATSCENTRSGATAVATAWVATTPSVAAA